MVPEAGNAGDDRRARGEYLHSERQLKRAWDSFHRRAYRQTFIHCRLGMVYLVNAVNILGTGEAPEEAPLDAFFRLLGGEIPLDRAGNYEAVLEPPELKAPGAVEWRNLSESVSDWLITRNIDRGRAFAFLNLAQETATLTIGAMARRFPGFFRDR